jgi:hypothetical protein
MERHQGLIEGSEPSSVSRRKGDEVSIGDLLMTANLLQRGVVVGKVRRPEDISVKLTKDA